MLGADFPTNDGAPKAADAFDEPGAGCAALDMMAPGKGGADLVMHGATTAPRPDGERLLAATALAIAFFGQAGAKNALALEEGGADHISSSKASKGVHASHAQAARNGSLTRRGDPRRL